MQRDMLSVEARGAAGDGRPAEAGAGGARPESRGAGCPRQSGGEARRGHGGSHGEVRDDVRRLGGRAQVHLGGERLRGHGGGGGSRREQLYVRRSFPRRGASSRRSAECAGGAQDGYARCRHAGRANAIRSALRGFRCGLVRCDPVLHAAQAEEAVVREQQHAAVHRGPQPGVHGRSERLRDAGAEPAS